MYYIGLDVHKRTISYCVTEAAGQVLQEGKIGSTRRELDAWIKTLPQPRMSDDLYRVDLRLSASACRQGKSGTSSDATGDRSGQEEERQGRCRQDRRLPALRFPAGVPHGFNRNP